MEKFLDGLSKVTGGLFTILMIWLIVDQFRLDKKVVEIFKGK